MQSESFPKQIKIKSKKLSSNLIIKEFLTGDALNKDSHMIYKAKFPSDKLNKTQCRYDAQLSLQKSANKQPDTNIQALKQQGLLESLRKESQTNQFSRHFNSNSEFLSQQRDQRCNKNSEYTMETGEQPQSEDAFADPKTSHRRFLKERKSSAHKRNQALVSIDGGNLLDGFTNIKLNNYTSTQDIDDHQMAVLERIQRNIASSMSCNQEDKRIICDLEEMELLESESDSSTKESKKQGSKPGQKMALNPIKHHKTKTTIHEKGLNKIKFLNLASLKSFQNKVGSDGPEFRKAPLNKALCDMINVGSEKNRVKDINESAKKEFYHVENQGSIFKTLDVRETGSFEPTQFLKIQNTPTHQQANKLMQFSNMKHDQCEPSKLFGRKIKVVTRVKQKPDIEQSETLTRIQKHLRSRNDSIYQGGSSSVITAPFNPPCLESKLSSALNSNQHNLRPSHQKLYSSFVNFEPRGVPQSTFSSRKTFQIQTIHSPPVLFKQQQLSARKPVYTIGSSPSALVQL